MPTVDTVRCYMRRFTSGWERETSECIPEPLRRSLTHVSITLYDDALSYPIIVIRTDKSKYIKGPLRVEIDLSTAHRVRHYLTLKKYCILAFAIWENDWHEFDHESSRVGFSAKMNIYCYSSARIGEVVESSARRNTGKGLRYRVRNRCDQLKLNSF